MSGPLASEDRPTRRVGNPSADGLGMRDPDNAQPLEVLPGLRAVSLYNDLSDAIDNPAATWQQRSVEPAVAAQLTTFELIIRRPINLMIMTMDVDYVWGFFSSGSVVALPDFGVGNVVRLHGPDDLTAGDSFKWAQGGSGPSIVPVAGADVPAGTNPMPPAGLRLRPNEDNPIFLLMQAQNANVGSTGVFIFHGLE